MRNNKLEILEAKMENAITDIRKTFNEYANEVTKESQESEIYSLRTYADTEYILMSCGTNLRGSEVFKAYYKKSKNSKVFIKEYSIRMNGSGGGDRVVKEYVKDLVATFNLGYTAASE